MSTSAFRSIWTARSYDIGIPTDVLGFSLVRDSTSESGRQAAPLRNPPSPGPRGAAMLNLRHGLPAASIRTCLLRAGRHNDISHRVLAFHLAEVADCNYAPMWGYPSAEVFAMKELRLSRRASRDLILAGRKLEQLTEIDHAFASGIISWSAVRELVRIAVPDSELQWLAQAKRVDQRALEHMVATHREGDRPNERKRGLPTNHTRVVMRLDAIRLEKWARVLHSIAESLGEDTPEDGAVVDVMFGVFQNGSASSNVLAPHAVTLSVCERCDATHALTDSGPELLPPELARAARRDAESTVAPVATHPDDQPSRPGSPEDTDPPTPTRLRNFVLTRDGHRCTFCASKSNLQVHHIVWRSQGGRNVAQNLTTACARCHSIIHDGNLEVAGEAPDRLRITRRNSPPPPPDTFSTQWIREVLVHAPTTRDAACVTTTRGSLIVAVHPTLGEHASHSTRAQNPQEPESPSVTQVAPWGGDEGPALNPEAQQENPVDARVSAEDLHTDTVSLLRRPNLKANAAAFQSVRGAQRTVRALKRAADSAEKRGCVMPHVLLSGPAGLGKSTLARATANYIGARCHEVNATAFTSLSGFATALRALQPNDILFIDEIQTLKTDCATMLLQGLEEGFVSVPQSDLDLMPQHVKLRPFTVLAATTHPDALSDAMRSRFTVVQEMVRYSKEDIVEVVQAEASKHSLTLEPTAAHRIALHADGIPRTALAYLALARDVAVTGNSFHVTMEHVAVAEEESGMDKDGLLPQERALVDTLKKYGATARARAARYIGLSQREVRENLEPALIRKGVLTITSRGLSLVSSPRLAP